MKSKIFKGFKVLKVFVLCLLFLGTAMLTVVAQTAPQSAVPAYLNGNQATLDWSNYTLSSIPPLPNGQTVASTLTLGDLPAAGDLSFSQLSPGTTIGDNPALQGITVGQLTQGIPGLANEKTGNSPSILKLAQNYAVQTGTKVANYYADKAVGALFKELPGFDKLPLGQYAGLLKGDPLSAIPGLAETALNKIPGLDQVALSKIPGLDKLPLSQIMDVAKYSPVAILDHTWGKNESKSLFKPISGSKEAGWEVPCNQSNCSYIELSDFRGSLDALPYHGARWIKGGPKIANGEQMVKGGSGALGKAFGGKEPTGRPFGKDLKIVLTGVNESSGTATFSLYTHACTKTVGCTPFTIGPFPLLTAHETDTVFLGLPTFGGAKSVIPKWAQAKVQAIQDQYEPTDDSQDTSMADCTQKALSVVDPSKSSAASSLLPGLIKDALGSGLDANQTAFLVAVADQKYSFNVDSSALISQYSAAAKSNVTSKSVNYFSAASSAGVSGDVANKAADYQSALKPCQLTTCSASGRLIRPTPGVAVSEFGMRFNPVHYVWRLHAGIDLGDGTGTQAKAADCGKVDYIGWDGGGYGNYVDIKHNNGLITRYAHLSQVQVKVGQPVKQGQTIALTGATGGVTGPHLHFETRPHGQPVNPRLKRLASAYSC
jgi:murein DD-endopeptidase MepM/ murein hydrolase activator NlpD